MKKKCVIVGAGTYGQAYAEYLQEEYDILGFMDDNGELINAYVSGYKVLGNRDYLFREMNPESIAVFVPIGNNEIRVELLRELEERKFSIPSFIHKSALIHESVKIGKAVYALPGTQVMPLSTLGDYTMISMGVNIAHHTSIAEGCFFSQGSNIGASVKIMKNAYFGIASTLMTGVNVVGENALIGAGAVVIRDVPDHAVMAGVPAKVLKYKKSGIGE